LKQSHRSEDNIFTGHPGVKLSSNSLYKIQKNPVIMMPEWLNTLKAAVTSLEEEAEKFYVKGNKSAGTRARKALQEIKTLSQDGRKHIQETRVAEVK
jgi:hypothetical protein